MVQQFRLRPQFTQRVQDQIGEYISRAQIDAALATFVRMVRSGHPYETDELGKNSLRVIFTILDRLDVCRRLRQHPPYPSAVLPFLEIYDRAGFPYSYVDSSDLYVGTPDFERVAHPQPGDLVVWPGHVGIVINPSEKVFFSAMRSGPGVDAFDAPYWKRREPARFYRYVKRGPVQNASKARDRALLTHQSK
jgi:hypothetical protein